MAAAARKVKMGRENGQSRLSYRGRNQGSSKLDTMSSEEIYITEPPKGCPTHTVERKMRTQIGTEIIFRHSIHSGRNCQEFVVASPKFSIKRWLTLTIIFNILGVLFELHTQDSRVMTGLLVVLILLLILKLHYKVKQESLLVMGSIGIQLTTTFASGRSVDTFFDISRVKNVIINEGITMQRVMFYLTLLLREDESKPFNKLIPLFQKTWPALSCLIEIRRGSQLVLGSRLKESPHQ